MTDLYLYFLKKFVRNPFQQNEIRYIIKQKITICEYITCYRCNKILQTSLLTTLSVSIPLTWTTLKFHKDMQKCFYFMILLLFLIAIMNQKLWHLFHFINYEPNTQPYTVFTSNLHTTFHRYSHQIYTQPYTGIYIKFTHITE